jgi:ParB-like chromosome segregation protein Spo0J
MSGKTGHTIELAQMGTLPVEKLLEMMPRDNPRELQAANRRRLTGSMLRWGIIGSPVVVNQRTNRVVAGNQRLKIMAEHGVENTPVVYVDIDAQEEVAMRAALNSGALSGRWTSRIKKQIEETQAMLPELAKELGLEQILEELDSAGKEGKTEAKFAVKPGRKLNVRLPKKEAEKVENMLDRIAKSHGLEEDDSGRTEAFKMIWKTVREKDFAKE